MKFSITTLMEAATLAQQHSVNGRVIYIAVVPEGLIVSGSKDGRSAAIDIGWRELDGNPGLLANAVHLIRDRV